jgi:hypothetical protein
MNNLPLKNSNISIDYTNENPIIFHNIKSGIWELLNRLFYILMLLSAAIVLAIYCIEQIVTIINEFDANKLVSFSGWALVEILIIMTIIHSLRQHPSEHFILKPSTVSYELGFSSKKIPVWKKPFVKQKSLILTKQHLQTLELSEDPMGVSILTVYQGKSEICLIEYGNSPDRKWIFKFLQCMYH